MSETQQVITDAKEVIMVMQITNGLMKKKKRLDVKHAKLDVNNA